MKTRWSSRVLVLGVGLVMGLSSAARSENVLLNPGFEQPEGRVGRIPDEWVVYSAKRADIGIVPTAGRDGTQCTKISCVGIPGHFQGIIQVANVEEDGRYTLSAWVMNDRSNSLQGSAYGQLAIEWKDDEGREVARTWGEALKPTMSRMRWELVQINRAKAPKGAVTAVIGIHLHDGDRGGKGSFFVDEVSFVRE
jgi:hypothetical protein